MSSQPKAHRIWILRDTYTFPVTGKEPTGVYVSSGLVGNQIKIPLFPLVAKELQYFGSFWGSYNDLREVMELAMKGLIKHHVRKFGLPEANDALDLLRERKILGRSVLVP